MDSHTIDERIDQGIIELEEGAVVNTEHGNLRGGLEKPLEQLIL